MNKHTLYIDGIAFWSPTLNTWGLARAAFRGEQAPATAADPPAPPSAPAPAPTARPAPALMAANERRRASDSVLVALEVATLAVAESGHAAKDLASVFASAHGDLPITDALCKTLAADPLLLSPMRFHHSVHNAASGYWAISSGSTAASTALAGFKCSFANGLLEAASQSASDATPRLLVGFDTEAIGPLASVNRSRGLLGVALVLSPTQSAASRWRLRWGVDSAERHALEMALTSGPNSKAMPTAVGTPRCAAALALAHNASADALPLFEVLAGDTAQSLALPLGPLLNLFLHLVPIVTTGTASDTA
jgi:Beta-ketoacyl synthase, N-terminal domain